MQLREGQIYRLRDRDMLLRACRCAGGWFELWELDHVEKFGISGPTYAVNGKFLVELEDCEVLAGYYIEEMGEDFLTIWDLEPVVFPEDGAPLLSKVDHRSTPESLKSRVTYASWSRLVTKNILEEIGGDVAIHLRNEWNDKDITLFFRQEKDDNSLQTTDRLSIPSDLLHRIDEVVDSLEKIPITSIVICRISGGNPDFYEDACIDNPQRDVKSEDYPCSDNVQLDLRQYLCWDNVKKVFDKWNIPFREGYRDHYNGYLSKEVLLNHDRLNNKPPRRLSAVLDYCDQRWLVLLSDGMPLSDMSLPGGLSISKYARTNVGFSYEH